MSSEVGKIIDVTDLKVTFAGTPPFEAVKGISFSIASGKTLALVGQSGSGKSVTSLALMGLLPETAQVEGTIKLIGYPPLNTLSGKSFTELRGKDIGMVFQEPMSALNPIMTCGHQLVESILTHKRQSKKAAEKEAIAWFDRVKLPEPQKLFRRYPHQLSGGQKQRVMIAMAMCHHPKLLIADEPTTALDVTVQSEIVQLMQSLQAEFGTALLFITHDLALARLLADDFLILENGRVIQTPLSFLLPESKATPQEQPAKPLLKAANVKVYYPEQHSVFGKPVRVFKAVDDVSFWLNEGETLGLVGESGCGKSTLSKSIMGLQPVTSGAIYFEGADITRFQSAQWRQLRREIQIIFQDPYASLNPRIKVGDAIKEPLLAHHLAEGKKAGQLMEELLDQVQLPKDAKNKYPHEFSGGQRQRICIARALAVDPKLVICDESVAALDVKIQGQILALLAALQKEKGLTYLFITHDLNVVRSISDRILVMEKGRIVEQGATSQIMNAPKESYTKRLLAAAPGI